MRMKLYSILFLLFVGNSKPQKNNFPEVTSLFNGFHEVTIKRHLQNGKTDEETHTRINDKSPKQLKEVSFSFQIKNVNHVIDLELNEELIPLDYRKSVRSDKGLNVENLSENVFHHCNYRGSVRGIRSSHVRLNTCEHLRGYIKLEDQFYEIEPYTSGNRTKHKIFPHVVTDGVNFCGLNTSSHQSTYSSFNQPGNRQKRDAKNEIRYMELMLVTNQYMMKLFKEKNKLEDEIFHLVNLLDGLYLSLKIRVVLSDLEIWEQDPYGMGQNPEDEYRKFKEYYAEQIKSPDKTSSWIRSDSTHLIFGGQFSSSIVGYANVRAMCTSDSNGIELYSLKTLRLAVVLAHELGHNLGLVHSDGCYCPSNSHCIMSSGVRDSESYKWAGCSENSLQRSIDQQAFPCLRNIPLRKNIYGPSVCGNGIIERGEQCDCGHVTQCESKCCDAATCKLLEGAECDVGGCCDSCKILKVGHICRDVNQNECDLPEYCNGMSYMCPDNMVIEDGTKCNNNKDYCVNGICQTYTQQCEETFVTGSTSAPDSCYEFLNNKGTAFANCGQSSGYYLRCSKENAKCGKLICTQRDGITVSHGELRCQDSIYVSMRKMGNEYGETGMVGEHTSCGKDMWCENQKCIPKPISKCSDKCFGRGVCNNNKNCHCDDGYAPPFCEKPGFGGSIDSGPISGRGSDKELILMVVMFAVVFPIILSSIFFLWFRYCNGKGTIEKWRRNRRERLAAVAAMKASQGDSRSNNFDLLNVQATNINPSISKSTPYLSPKSDITPKNSISIGYAPIKPPPSRQPPSRPPPPPKNTYGKLIPPTRPAPSPPSQPPPRPKSLPKSRLAPFQI